MGRGNTFISFGNSYFSSLYESFNPLTTLNKQHFVERFSGNSLRALWTQRNLRTSATFAMVDSIDGGFTITGTGGTNEGGIDFNNKRHYSNTGSVMIFVGKTSVIGADIQRIDMINDPTQVLDTATLDYAGIYQNGSNWTLANNLGSGSGSSSTILSTDTSKHVFRVIIGSSSISATIDGANTTTNSTNLPTKSMQPRLAEGNGSGVFTCNYLEVYNT